MQYIKIRNDELYHHGILGQKWGKRNGPPYPLGSSDHSVSEQKAGWRKSLSGNGQESAKTRRKKRDAEIQSRHTRAEREIESKYKRGENLSEEDYERLNRADDEARNAWKESKDQYKKEKFEEKIKRISEKDPARGRMLERNREIQDRYDKIEREIESKYKKGETLSKADRKRLDKAGEDLTTAFIKSEMQYNKEKKTEKQQKKFQKNVDRNWMKAYNKSAKRFNNEISEFNKKWDDKFSKEGTSNDVSKSKYYKEYKKEAGKLWTDIYKSEAVNMFGNAPDKGKDWLNNLPLMNIYD